MDTFLENFLARAKTTGGITILAALAATIAATWNTGPYFLINVLLTGGMLALVAVGLALILGVLNIASFVHGDYFMIGTLIAYFVFTPLQTYLSAHPNPALAFCAPLIAIFAAFLGGGAAGALTEVMVFAPMRRRSRENWVMNSFLLTVGLAVVLVNADLLIFGADFRGITQYWSGRPFEILNVFIARDRAYIFILAMLIVTSFGLFMSKTRIGRAIRAVSQDETGALTAGININGIMMLTMALGCAMASVAGGGLLFLYPSYPNVGLEPLYMAWFIVILVGMGNISGAVIGGFLVALLKVLTVQYIGPGWDLVIPAALIMLLLIFKPSGIFGSEVRGALNK